VGERASNRMAHSQALTDENFRPLRDPRLKVPAPTGKAVEAA